MELKTETALAPTTDRVTHPAIAMAIELLIQSAQDLTECLSTADGPDWKNNPGTKAAYDKDLATVAALRTAQAEIEAPLLARLLLVAESAAACQLAKYEAMAGIEVQKRIAALEESVKASAEESVQLKAWLTFLVQNDFYVQRVSGKYRVRQVIDACTIGTLCETMNLALETAMNSDDQEAAVLHVFGGPL